MPHTMDMPTMMMDERSCAGSCSSSAVCVMLVYPLYVHITDTNACPTSLAVVVAEARHACGCVKLSRMVLEERAAAMTLAARAHGRKSGRGPPLFGVNRGARRAARRRTRKRGSSR